MNIRQYSQVRDQTKARGFTLIELMVAVAILGIILAVAIPSYQVWVLKSGRPEAKAVLMQASQTLERCFTRFSSYNDAQCGLAAGDTIDSENGKYQLTVTRATPTTFSLTAAPQGVQAKDTECASFTLDQTGTRAVTGTADSEKCWGR